MTLINPSSLHRFWKYHSNLIPGPAARKAGGPTCLHDGLVEGPACVILCHTSSALPRSPSKAEQIRKLESSAAGMQVLPLLREVSFPFVIKLLSALGRTMYSQFHFLFSCS